MRKIPFIVFFGFIFGIFYTNCTPNQFSLKEQALLAEPPQQDQQQIPPSSSVTTSTTQASFSSSGEQSSWRNYYGIAWDDTPANHIKYAKQMGYDYIAIKNGAKINDYKTNPDIAGFKFYFIDPITYTPVLEGHKRGVSTLQEYTKTEKDWYENNMVWKSNDPFPNNLASGYFKGVSTAYNVEWDWQQQRVIDEVVERIITLAHSYEDSSLSFSFAGVLIDVPRLYGEFAYWNGVNGSLGKATGLSYWTGADSGLLHGVITHEYATYREGKAAYLKKLSSRMKEEFPNAKWIMQPSRIYSTVSGDEWVNTIKNRADKDALTPDMLSAEGSTTDFVDDANNFTSGVNLSKDRVENTHHTDITESNNRLIAAKAGINGAWFNWFGSFMAAGHSPDFQSITEVYPRLKLIRVISNWDNLTNVPLSDRSWDGSVYKSSRSYISSDVMYSRHWKNNKLFAVFMSTNGVVKINDGETITNIKSVDDYFMENGDASTDFIITGNEIKLKSSVTIDVDSTNNQTKGKGYIFTLKIQ